MSLGNLWSFQQMVINNLACKRINFYLNSYFIKKLTDMHSRSIRKIIKLLEENEEGNFHDFG